MLCPIDQSELVISERQGIEIDYCPKCRGVWLDRGELDKIIERSDRDDDDDRQVRRESPDTRHEQSSTRPTKLTDVFRKRDDDDDDDYKIDPKTGRRKKKRGSFLEDLFDM